MYEEFGPRLLGLLLAGSLVRSTADDFSDVDLVVVFNGDWHQRRRVVLLGVDVDLMINCRDQLFDVITHERNDAYIESLAEGSILCDTRGCLAELQALASSARNAPRRASAANGAYAHVQRLNSVLKSYFRCAETGSTDAAFQLHLLIMNGISAYYFFARRWRPSRNVLLSDLQANAPTLYESLEALFDPSRPVEAKLFLAQRFVEAIYAFDPAACLSNQSAKFVFKPPRTGVIRSGESVISVTTPLEL
jgi:hypothetical protein